MGVLVSVYVPLFFLGDNVRNGRQQARLLDIAKLIVDRCAKDANLRCERHVSVKERGNVDIVLADLCLERAVVALEVVLDKETIYLCWVNIHLDRRHRDD